LYISGFDGTTSEDLRNVYRFGHLQTDGMYLQFVLAPWSLSVDRAVFSPPVLRLGTLGVPGHFLVGYIPCSHFQSLPSLIVRTEK